MKVKLSSKSWKALYFASGEAKLDIKLSKRLKTICAQLLKHKKLADIGTDHAYLPCYAVLKGVVPYAIGTEVNAGPYQSAASFVKRLRLQKYIDIRLGDGLSVIEKGEAEQIVIAGMGGSLIVKILDNGKEKLHEVQRLILQPNVAADKVRRWLYENGWTIVDENILEEDGMVYEIVVAEPGKDDRVFTEKDFLFGPYLHEEKSAVFRKKWRNELNKLEKILHELRKAGESDKVQVKREEVERTICLIEEVLA